MSQAGGVDTEPLKWPIAPDGYIPNSVIRRWMRKGKELNTGACWHDTRRGLHQVTADDVKRNEKGEDNEKDKEEKTKVEGKERADEKKEKEEDQVGRTVLVKQFCDSQTTPQNQLKTLDDEKMNVAPQSQEVGSSKTGNFTPTSCHENGPRQLRGLREDMQLHDTITVPLEYLSEANKQRESTFILKEWPAPPVAGPVLCSADTTIPKQEPKITSYTPPIELENLTPHPLKPPSPTPEDPQPQPDLGPPDCSPITDKRFLLSSTKYSNIREQAQVSLDREVLQLFKKFKAGNKNSSCNKVSSTAKCPPASKAMQSNIQVNTGELKLYSGLGTPPEFRTMLPPRIIHPECPNHRPCSDCVAQFAQTILPKDQRGHKSMPEWRKSLYTRISLHGLCSPRAAKLAAADHLVKSSSARQLAAIIPSLRPGQAAAHQRVVQRIQMKDTLEPAFFHFHHVIPKASQHSFFTLNPCGKTQYGRLQFDWMRGSEEDRLLRVSAVKTKDTAQTAVDENRALYHIDRSA